MNAIALKTMAKASHKSYEGKSRFPKLSSFVTDRAKILAAAGLETLKLL